MKEKQPVLQTADYARLAAFRHALRAFLHFGEQTAAESGLTGRDYQALLILRGWPEGSAATINDVAQQLFLKHNSTVGLVDRLAAEGLVVRVSSSVDRRKVELKLTRKGSQVVARIAGRNRGELKRLGPDLERFFHDLVAEGRKVEGR